MVIERWNKLIEERMGIGYEIVFVDLELDENADRLEPHKLYMPALIVINGREYNFPSSAISWGGLTGLYEEFRRLERVLTK